MAVTRATAKIQNGDDVVLDFTFSATLLEFEALSKILNEKIQFGASDAFTLCCELRNALNLMTADLRRRTMYTEADLTK